MESDDDEGAGVDWARVRHDYESGVETLSEIEIRHGINRDAIARWRRKEGWAPRRPTNQRSQRRQLIARLLAVLENQTRLMEARMGKTDSVDAAEMRLLETMTKTLDRLIALERAEAAKEPRRRADPEVAALRKKLADRIAVLETK